MEIQKSKIQKPQIALLQEKAGIYVVKLTLALEKAGYDVELLTRERYPWFYHFFCFFHLVWRRKKYSVVHAHSSGSALAMKMAWWFTGVPSVLTVHNTHIFEERWTLKKILDRVMCMETKYQQEISITERFLKAVNVNEQVLVIPPGIDVSIFEAVETEKSEGFRVLYAGDLTREKGVDVLLKAADALDIHVDILGDGPELNRLKNLARSLTHAKVRFHGEKTGETRLKLFKGANLFVMPSRVDGLPYELLEAAAARLPILASDVGDHRRVVIDGVNGQLVHAGDLEDWTRYLEQYTLHPHLKQMGDASFDLVSQEFTWEIAMEKHLRIYETLRAGKGRPQMKWWNLPKLWLSRMKKEELKVSKRSLRFCLTADLEPSSTHDIEHLSEFMNLYLDFCSVLEVKSTLFLEWDLLSSLEQELKKMRKKGHEIGIKIRAVDFQTGASRKATLRGLRESLNGLRLKGVVQIRIPDSEELTDELAEMIREAGFECVPVSQDPLPHLTPVKLNLEGTLPLTDEAFLQVVLRLRAEQEGTGLKPTLVFQARSWEFQTRDGIPYASGENFTALSKRLALLKEHMKLEFHTLSDL